MTPHPIAEMLQVELAAGRSTILRIAQSADLGTFVPVAAECHHNARRWAAEHPNSRVVEGWVSAGDFIFEKHSVVTDEHDELLCITPRERSAYNGPFIQHQGEWSAVPFADLPAQVIVPAIVEGALRALMHGPQFSVDPWTVGPERQLSGEVRAAYLCWECGLAWPSHALIRSSYRHIEPSKAVHPEPSADCVNRAIGIICP